MVEDKLKKKKKRQKRKMMNYACGMNTILKKRSRAHKTPLWASFYQKKLCTRTPLLWDWPKSGANPVEYILQKWKQDGITSLWKIGSTPKES